MRLVCADKGAKVVEFRWIRGLVEMNVEIESDVVLLAAGHMKTADTKRWWWWWWLTESKKK